MIHILIYSVGIVICLIARAYIRALQARQQASSNCCSNCRCHH